MALSPMGKVLDWPGSPTLLTVPEGDEPPVRSSIRPLANPMSGVLASGNFEDTLTPFFRERYHYAPPEESDLARAR